MKLPIDGRVTRLCRDDRQLFDETLQVLADELPDVLDAFCRRVVPPGCQLARIISHEYADDLKPYARLLLLDLRWVAQVPGWSPTMRRERAMWALEMAGFPESAKQTMNN